MCEAQGGCCVVGSKYSRLTTPCWQFWAVGRWSGSDRSFSGATPATIGCIYAHDFACPMNSRFAYGRHAPDGLAKTFAGQRLRTHQFRYSSEMSGRLQQGSVRECDAAISTSNTEQRDGRVSETGP